MDTYLLLQLKSVGQMHEDGTTPVDMVLINVENEDFCENSKEVKRLRDSIESVRLNAENLAKDSKMALNQLVSQAYHKYRGYK
jgi:hypothetical protein